MISNIRKISHNILIVSDLIVHLEEKHYFIHYLLIVRKMYKIFSYQDLSYAANKMQKYLKHSFL